jgi:hypothetical protein
MEVFFHHCVDGIFGGGLAEIPGYTNDEWLMTSKDKLSLPGDNVHNSNFDEVFHR